MIPWKHQKTQGMRPYENFVTTYSSDYKPPSERHPQVNQMKPRTEVKAAWESTTLPQTDRETCPVFHQYFYKTVNSSYGSSDWLQPPCPLSHAFSPTFGNLAPSVSEASVVVGSALPEARTQEVGVARETGVLLGEEEKGQKGQLCYAFGGKANTLEQQEANNEPQQKIDVLYEEGVIVLFSDYGPACCEDCLRSVCREAGLQHLLHLPVASSPIITIKEIRDNSVYLRGLRPVIRLQNITSLQPAFGLTQSLAHVLPAVYRTEPSRRPWLTEYQANYNAPWAQPKIQQSAFHHRHPPH